MHEILEEYMRYITSVRVLSPATCTGYRGDLEAFDASLEGRDVLSCTHHDVRNFAAVLSMSGKAASSVNRALSAVKGFYRWASRFGYAVADPSNHVSGLKSRRPLPDVLFEEEAATLVEAPDGADFRSLRDRALLEFFYSTGCRLAEVATLRDTRLSLRSSEAKVTGKGSRERIVFLNPKAKEALGAYIAMRDAAFPEREKGGYTFVSARGRGLSRRGIALVVKRWAERAAIKKNVSPHTFRHSFATHLMDRGADLRLVQELLGHANVSTTQIYTHVSLDKLRVVYERAHPHG